MCEPVTTSIAVGSSALSYVQQKKQASHQNKVNELNRENAVESLGLEYGGLSGEQRAEAARAAQSIADVRREAEQAKGRVSAAAAEAGVAGASVDAVLDDFEAQEGRHVAAVLLNEQAARANIQRRKQGARIGASGKLASATPVAGPSLMAAALGAFADSYQSHLQIEANKKE